MHIRKANNFRTLILAAALAGAAALASVALASGTSLTTEYTKAGKVIATTSGRAVYAFSRDTSSQSNCSAKCASAWPPLTGSATVAKGGGLNSKLLGTIKRSGGTQVTYDHHPLYLNSRDNAHTTRGEASTAFGGKWYLVGPRGRAVKPCKGACLPQGY